MAEERRCQAPRLCANNCGFFGSPAMQDLCSKCYRDLQPKEQQSSSAKHALTQTLSSSSASTSASLLSPSSDVDVSPARGGGVNADDHRGGVIDNDLVPKVARTTTTSYSSGGNRCEACKRKVGLTGFKCRCGMMLCGTHRYPEQHRCGFDFRGTGKEQIARANPVIKAPKLNKI